DSVTIVDRRAGTVELRWTDVEDTGGGALSTYELRCSSTPILDEAGWAMASPISLGALIPGALGTVRAPTLGGFRLGVQEYCALRAADAVGAQTPLGANGAVLLEFLQTPVTQGGSAGLGLSVGPGGDLNGDGIADLIVGGTSSAFVYFGSAVGLPASPSVSIGGPSGFGRIVTGIGDFNGDGMDDFVVSSHSESSSQGGAYVFFGRATWPATIDVSASCAASICFRGSDTFGFASYGLAAAGDFDADGFPDLAIGSPFAAGFVGQVYLIRGSASYVEGSELFLPTDAGVGFEGFLIPAPAGASQFGTSLTAFAGTPGSQLVVGAPGGSGVLGSVHRISGRAQTSASLEMITDAVLVGTGREASFGNRVTNFGDVDGNGRAELGVYETWLGGQTHLLHGTASGHSTAASTLIRNNLGASGADNFGRHRAAGAHPIFGTLGDIDGDGATDVLLGSSARAGGAGTAEIFYGGSLPAEWLRSLADVSLAPSTSGEISAGYVGDVDGDGHLDLAVGAPLAAAGAGTFWIYH
ncbi:MAG: FG-GAP-like repeat-containing protein, partial [Myxococcales bacterium]|nr:FG-GAP-like repeat-containing protein [Myxococcales bacterium]